jgi:sialic acid synthase SpsE
MIIAEISGNHGGSKAQALRLIDAAALAGADAVKFQCWSAGEMAIPGYIIQDGLWEGKDLAELYKEIYTPWYWFPELFEKAKSVGLVAFASVFDKDALTFLEALDCPMYKIASHELGDSILLANVARTKKPVLLSTGASDLDQVGEAVRVLTSNGCEKLTLLHCVSEYPTDLSKANLGRIDQLRDYWPDVGLSDHSKGWLVPAVATGIGATVIEKHLKVPGVDCQDDAFSLFPDDFASMVDAVKQARAMLTKVEATNKIPLLNRGLYFARDLPQGHIIELSDLVTRRPYNGCDPSLYLSIIGCKLKYPVSALESVNYHSFTKQ